MVKYAVFVLAYVLMLGISPRSEHLMENILAYVLHLRYYSGIGASSSGWVDVPAISHTPLMGTLLVPAYWLVTLFVMMLVDLTLWLSWKLHLLHDWAFGKLLDALPNPKQDPRQETSVVLVNSEETS